MEGLLQENGVSIVGLKFGIIGNINIDAHLFQPISWATGTAKPIQNEFSWSNLSSILFVEQPVGTGFTQGVPNIRVSSISLMVSYTTNPDFAHSAE